MGATNAWTAALVVVFERVDETGRVEPLGAVAEFAELVVEICEVVVAVEVVENGGLVANAAFHVAETVIVAWVVVAVVALVGEEVVVVDVVAGESASLVAVFAAGYEIVQRCKQLVIAVWRVVPLHQQRDDEILPLVA